MLKYLSYIATVVWTIIRKIPIWIPYIMLILPFRHYARNVVYNYVLDNGIYLKRLVEKSIIKIDSIYRILPSHGTNGGYIKRRHVSILEYKLVYYILWQWYDDDSWYDTWSVKYNENTLAGEHLTWLPSYVKGKLQAALDNAPIGGNSFDIGDRRRTSPSYPFWSVLLWTIRNTSYNSRYMTWEKREGDPHIFLFEFKNGWKFGWKEREGRRLEIINGKKNYDLVAFGWD